MTHSLRSLPCVAPTLLVCLLFALPTVAEAEAVKPAQPELGGHGGLLELAMAGPFASPRAIEAGGAAPLHAVEEPCPAPPPPPQTPAPSGNTSGGFLDFNLYPYMTSAEADSVFTINALAKLPYGFQYFSLLNLNNQADSAALYDTNSYYTEQNLRWAVPGPVPVDLTVQYNMRSGDDNDRLRLGFRLRFEGLPLLGELMKAIHLSYSVNFHLLQFDHVDDYIWQMEHVVRLDFPYLDRRLYVAGFGDHTMGEVVPGVTAYPLIGELQVGARLIEEFYAVAEFRWNDFRAATKNRGNIALGLQYVVKW